MATIATLVVEIKVEKSGFNRDVDGAGNALDKTSKKAESATQRFKRLGASMARIAKVAGTIVVGGLAAATAATIKAAQVAGEYDANLTKLRATLNNAGEQDAVAAADRFAEFASELQRTTGISDTTTLAAGAMGAAFGLTGKGLEGAALAAANMTAVTGSLEGNMRLISVAAAGNVSVLARYVPALKGVEQGALSAEQVLAAVNSQFGGAAQAAAQNYQGRLEILGSASGDVVKEFGFVVTRSEIVNSVLVEAAKVTEQLTAFINRNRETIQTWISQGFELAIDSVLFMIDAVELAAKAIAAFQVVGNLAIGGMIDLWSRFLGVMNIVTKSLSVLARAAGLDDLAKTLTTTSTVLDRMKKSTEGVRDVFFESADAGLKSFETISKTADAARNKTIEFEENVLAGAASIEVLGASAAAAAPSLDFLNNNLKEMEEAQLKAIEAAQEAMQQSIDTAMQLGNAFGATFSAFTAGTEASQDAIRALAGTILDVVQDSVTKVITARAAEAAAGAASSQASIPVVGPILAAAAAAAMFGLVRGFLTKFHEGGTVTRDDLFRLPGMNPNEGLIVAAAGEKVLDPAQSRAFDQGAAGGGGGDTFVFQQLVPDTRASLRANLRKTQLSAELKRTRRNSRGR